MACSQKTDVLMLHLLGQCNLECAHCYMDGSPRRRERLPLNLVLAALGECRELGVGNISLTGAQMEINNTVNAGTGTVTITSSTTGRNMTFGDASDSNSSSMLDVDAARGLLEQIEEAQGAIQGKARFSSPKARDGVLSLYDQAATDLRERIKRRLN